MTIGVCDWGVGGLGFYGLLRAARPDLDVLYLGDQGVPGYGKLPRPVLAARLRAVMARFREEGVSQVVVACNAASTVLDEVRVAGVQATGMILPTLEGLGSRLSPQPPLGDEPLGEGKSRIGLIGGRRTVLSGAYARPLRAAGWAVRSRVAQPLSGLIEAGDLAGAKRALGPILGPLRGIDRLVLACTHYVVLEDAIRAHLPGTELVDPAAYAWAAVAPALPAPTDHLGEVRFVTTGDPGCMAEAAHRAFGVVCRPRSIVIRPS